MGMHVQSMIKLLVICHPSTCSGVFSCCHLCFAVLGVPLLIHHNGLGIYSAYGSGERWS